jgi:hypothetical protein
MRAIRDAFNHVLALLVAVLQSGIDRGAGAAPASEHETDGADWNDRNADAGCGAVFALAIKILSTSTLNERGDCLRRIARSPRCWRYPNGIGRVCMFADTGVGMDACTRGLGRPRRLLRLRLDASEVEERVNGGTGSDQQGL